MSPGPPVDIITILPTLMTFVIQMIGDSYPLPAGQTTFVSALQASQPPSSESASTALGRLGPLREPPTGPAVTFPSLCPSFRSLDPDLPLVRLLTRARCACGRGVCVLDSAPACAPSPRATDSTRRLARGQAFNFLRVVRLIKVQHLILR